MSYRRLRSLSSSYDDYRYENVGPTQADDKEPLVTEQDTYLHRDPDLECLECRLCLTQHNTEQEYLEHCQTERHRRNHARKVRSEKMDMPVSATVMATILKLGGVLG